MTPRAHFRWGGLLVILAAALWSAGEVLIRLGACGLPAHVLYSLGAAALVPAVALVYLALGEVAANAAAPGYVLATTGLLLANVAAFLSLAGAAGIAGMDTALAEIWGWLRASLPLRDLGLLLLGIATVRTGFLPRPAGGLVALGVLFRLPLPGPLDPAGPWFALTGIAGAILLGAGLAWAGAAIWRASDLPRAAVPPSAPPVRRSRSWQGIFVILSAFIYILNAHTNNIGELSLFDGLVNLLGMLTLPVALTLLHARQAHRAGAAGFAGFLLALPGAALMAVPAYFIAAQLAGQLADNRALFAAWADIPIATTGQIMLVLGLFVFGAAAVRAEVYPRWAGWLVAAGIALSIPAFVQAQAYYFLVFWAVGATLTGIGLSRMGWDLLRPPPGP